MTSKFYPKVISLFLACVFLLQSVNAVVANAADTSSIYEAKFRLGTMLRDNVLIKSFFNFKVVVNKNSVKLFADGNYSNLGYVWSDQYDIKIYDKQGTPRFDLTLNDWSDVYSGATDFINRMNSENIQIGEIIEIRSKLWGDTMHFGWDTDKYYKKSPMHDAMDGKLLSFTITKNGIIQNTPTTKVLEKKEYKNILTLRVKNNNTGIEEDRKINITSFNDVTSGTNVSRYWLQMKSDDFGNAKGYSWADNYIIFGETQDFLGRSIDRGVNLRKGASVEDGLKELINAFIYFSSVFKEPTLTFQSDNNTMRLYSNPDEEPSLFTNTNQDFGQRWARNRVSFMDTKFGLMECK